MERRDVTAAAASGVAGLGATVLGMPSVAGAAPGGAHGPAGGRPSASWAWCSCPHVNDPNVTPVFPGDPEFTLTTVTTVPEDGFYMQYVEEGEHTGTHWGAPAHFREGGLTADQLDPGTCSCRLPKSTCGRRWRATTTTA